MTSEQQDAPTGQITCQRCEGSGVWKYPIPSLCSWCGGIGSLSDLVHRSRHIDQERSDKGRDGVSKSISIRGLGDQGEPQWCIVRFGAVRRTALMARLRQVAEALMIPVGADTNDARRLVTEVRTDLEQECVVVTAITPLHCTVEQLQADLLALVPPA